MMSSPSKLYNSIQPSYRPIISAMVFVDDDYVLRSILIYLDAISLQTASAVSKRLRKAVNDTAIQILAHIKASGDVLLDADDFGAYSHTIYYEEPESSRIGSTSSIKRLYEISKQKIFLLGGGSFDEGVDSYKRCDSSDNLLRGSWSKLKGMSTKRGSFSTEALVYKGLVMVFSGDDRVSCGTNELYDPLAEQWLHLPELPSRIMYGSACVGPFGKVVYSGGMENETGEYCDSIYLMDLAERDDGSSSSSSSSSSSPDGSAADDDVISHCSSTRANVFRWSLAEGSRLLQARYGHSSACLGNIVYMAGGYFTNDVGEAHYIDTVETYDPFSGAVSFISPMNSRRIFFKLTVLNNRLFAIGGNVTRNGGQEEGTIESYDESTGTWSVVTKYIRIRRVHSVTTVDNKILLIGGRDENYSNLNDFDTFDVNTGLWNDGVGASQGDNDCCGGDGDSDGGGDKGSSGSLSSRSLNRTMVGGAAVTLNSKRLTWS